MRLNAGGYDGAMAMRDGEVLLGEPDEAARLSAVRATGLGAVPDLDMDRFAAVVARVLTVPVALVALVDDARQLLPGAVGLAPAWQQRRETPLSPSWQRAVLSGEELVVTDARLDPRVRDSPAIGDLGVVACAGMPLTDGAGQVLGTLCAIDDRPREWTRDELDLLADLAEVCSVALRARAAAAVAEEALTSQRQAQAAAMELSARVDAALRRSELLLTASQEFTGTVTLPDVVATVKRLIGGEFRAAHVSVALRDGVDGVRVFGLEGLPAELASRARFPVTDRVPVSTVLHTGRHLAFADRAGLVAAYPGLRPVVKAAGWEATLFTPLLGPTGVIGALTIAWEHPRPLDVEERAVIVSVAGYVTQAVQRARRLTDRVEAAAILQEAMLTPLPTIDGLQVTARYQPAHNLDQVGGDWYDAVVTQTGFLSLVIGDVTGHDLRAAAQMSQLRSMLRGYLVDRHEPPSALLRRLDQANVTLGARSIATALVAHFQHRPGHPVTMSWSNAGHPVPILIHPGGTVHTLTGRDPLLGVTLRTRRTTRKAVLPPGATLLLHTDGLVERRDQSLDEMTARLHKVLTAHAATGLEDLVDTVLDTVPPTDHEDDIALLALRTPDPT
ncbi:SpoIIE family protein phosphatase [Micromonospora fluostatini]|uniref:SpoIIE family protein phosphatase n=1 Tax=Micromonospora sp. JCM 30529 TaxID=3421643 RepID=UPI003D186A86